MLTSDSSSFIAADGINNEPLKQDLSPDTTGETSKDEPDEPALMNMLPDDAHAEEDPEDNEPYLAEENNDDDSPSADADNPSAQGILYK